MVAIFVFVKEFDATPKLHQNKFSTNFEDVFTYNCMLRNKRNKKKLIIGANKKNEHIRDGTMLK